MPTYQEETEEKTAITKSEHITFWTFRLVGYFIIILCISFLICFLHCFFVWNKNDKTYHDIERNINEDEAIFQSGNNHYDESGSNNNHQY